MALIHVSRSGASLGEFERERVREGLRTGEFIGTDLGWTEGMTTWRPLAEFEDFLAGKSEAPSVAATPAGLPPMVPAISAAAAAPEGSGLPWERRAELGLVQAFIQTIGIVLTRPIEAFTVMKREGGLGEPLIYAVIGGSIGALIGFAFQMLLQSFGFALGGQDALGGMMAAGGVTLLVVLLVPFFVVLTMFLSAAIFHLVLMMLGGANRPFETTFRVVCYAAGSANILQIIPFCGGVISAVWGLVLYILGLRQTHQTTTGIAVAAVLLPIALCCVGGILLAIAIPVLVANFS